MDSRFKWEKCNHESSGRKLERIPSKLQNGKDLTMTTILDAVKED